MDVVEDKDDGAEQLEAAHEQSSWLGLSDWVDLDVFADGRFLGSSSSRSEFACHFRASSSIERKNM